MDDVPPTHDDLEPTVATPRIEVPPPARPGTYDGPIEEGVVLGPAPPASAAQAKPIGPRFRVGNPFGYTLARFTAFAVDLVLVSGVLTILAYALIAINPITGLPTNTQQGFDATLAMGIVLALLYIIAAEGSLGTTIGKLAFGLHVYALRDRTVGLGRAFARMLLRPVDTLVIGAILSLLPGHRRLGDLVSGTVVVPESRFHGYARYVGWLLILIVAGIPFVLVGAPRTFAGLIAFVEFLPGIVARLWLLVQRALGAVPH